ncbi:MAG: urease accessory protein UreF [Planctomycetes bacterium]|nr:urease accessory protein UreF [Planctomycetota bacterium]
MTVAANVHSPSMQMHDWTCWQLIDSAFPSGGFTHSGGLEVARATGLVHDGASLGQYVQTALVQAAFGACPFIHATYADSQNFQEHDAHCDAMLLNHVANRASRRQGGALLRSTSMVYRSEELTRIEAMARQERTPGHLACVFGVLGQAVGLDLERTRDLFLFTTVRGLLSAGTRLNIVGPFEAQSLQRELEGAARSVSAQSAGLGPADACQTAPLMDILQGGQDRLYSRLFQS